MTSVRAWTEREGWEYVCLDDAFFSLAPGWVHQACQGNIYAVTDIARLVWARRKLDEGYDRVVWADADILVFDPEAFGQELARVRGHGLSRELFLRVAASGKVTALHGINNAVMVFEHDDSMLTDYLEACYARLCSLAHGPVPRTALGPALLRQIATTKPLRLIDGVGLFTPAIMRHVASGGSALTQQYLTQSAAFPVAANLCHFMRNGTPHHRRAEFDRVYDKAITRLLDTKGSVLTGPRVETVV